MMYTCLPKKNFIYVVQPVDSKDAATELSQVKNEVLEAVEELRSADRYHQACVQAQLAEMRSD